ncbi:hypothetical protein AAVH_00019 [Aphelenchoides avenae]|nr:hypothetical protein AAVH_00019 [Aphelenchus avenae]
MVDRLSIDFSNLALPLTDGLDEETWLISPGEDGQKSEELMQWLQGSTKTLDFQTRSALSRRLQKRRQKKEAATGRLTQTVDKSLGMIEETSHEGAHGSENNNHKFVEADRKPAVDESDEGTQAAPQKRTDFQAADKNVPLPLSEKLNVVMEQDERFTRSTDSLSKSFSSDAVMRASDTCDSPDVTPKVSVTAPTPSEPWSTPVRAPRAPLKTTVNGATQNGGRQPQHSPVQNGYKNKNAEDEELSDIERRAKQQEEELRMEMLQRRERVASSQGDRTPSTRPTSSSSTSSGNPLVTSRSVDFHATTYLTPRSADGSMTDLSANSNPGSVSRLPILRRPTVHGKTGIPMPATRAMTPKSSIPNVRSAYTRTLTGYAYRQPQQHSRPMSPRSDVGTLRDDECF